MSGDSPSSSSTNGSVMTSSARCRSWTLIGAHTRVITRAAIDLEPACPPPPHPPFSRSTAAVAPSPRSAAAFLALNNQVILTLLRWISSVVFSTSAPGSGREQRGEESDDTEETDEDDVEETEAGEKKRSAAASAMLAEVLEVLNAAPRPEGLDPIDCHTNLMEAGFDSLQVMELRRQLESAGPSGCVLTATAVMEHSTPAALVDHMMTWHEASATTDEVKRNAPKKRKQMKIYGGESSESDGGVSPSSSSSPSARAGSTSSLRGADNGRDPKRATFILLGFTALVLLVMCVTLAVALYLQQQKYCTVPRHW